MAESVVRAPIEVGTASVTTASFRSAAPVRRWMTIDRRTSASVIISHTMTPNRLATDTTDRPHTTSDGAVQLATARPSISSQPEACARLITNRSGGRTSTTTPDLVAARRPDALRTTQAESSPAGLGSDWSGCGFGVGIAFKPVGDQAQVSLMTSGDPLRGTATAQADHPREGCLRVLLVHVGAQRGST